MSSLNHVMLIGNLGRDPEVRYTPSGQAIANLSVATSIKRAQKDGAKAEETAWHRVVLFDRLAQLAEQYLIKGSRIYIDGRLRYREYTDKQGVKREVTEVLGQRVVMLGGERKDAPPPPARSNNTTPARPDTAFDDLDDDVPF